MAIVTLLGRDFILAPYTLGQLREAAPIIERVNAAASIGLIASTMGAARDIIEIIAIGVRLIEPEYTAERIADETYPRDVPALEAAFHAILAESGFKAGAEGPVSTHSDTPLAEQIDDLIIYMVAAGVEGGSKRRIEDEWTLPAASRLQAHWRKFGPPVHIATAVLSAALGNKLTSDARPIEVSQEDELRDMMASLPMTVAPPIKQGRAAWQWEQILLRRNALSEGSPDAR